MLWACHPGFIRGSRLVVVVGCDCQVLMVACGLC